LRTGGYPIIFHKLLHKFTHTLLQLYLQYQYLDALDEDERLVWDKKNTIKDGDDIISDDIFELLETMEVGHEKRLDAFYSLKQKLQTDQKKPINIRFLNED